MGTSGRCGDEGGVLNGSGGLSSAWLLFCRGGRPGGGSMLVFCSGVLSVLSVGILPSLFQNNIADQWLAISCDKSLGCTRRKT